MNIDYIRQIDLLPLENLGFPITIIGCGAIGSTTTLALAKMGCRNLLIYDPDSVKAHNIPNQFFPLASLGLPKVEALQGVLQDFTECEPLIERKAVEGEPLQGVCILAVDSMGARKAIWKGIRGNPAVLLLIDARMGAEVGLIYCIRPTDREQIEFYEGSLYSDEEAIDLPCTARSIIYTPLFMAALIADLVKRYAVGEPLPKEIIADLKLLTLKVTYERSERGLVKGRSDHAEGLLRPEPSRVRQGGLSPSGGRPGQGELHQVP